METQLAKVDKPFQLNFFDAQQLATVQRVAGMFSSSELVPDMYNAGKVGKDKAIANCVIALEMASRAGASPLMIMQNLVIIYGRPSWSSKYLISTVNTCGRFETLKFRIEKKGSAKGTKYIEYETKWVDGKKRSTPHNKVFDEDVDNLVCVAYTTPKGSDDVIESTPISIKMAIEEGWYTKAGSKWRTMPQQMLYYRAASFWTNAYAPELSMGMKTVEEQHDIIDITDIQPDARADAEIGKNANKTEVKMDDDNKDPKAAEEKPKDDSGKGKTAAEKPNAGASTPPPSSNGNGQQRAF